MRAIPVLSLTLPATVPCLLGLAIYPTWLPMNFAVCLVTRLSRVGKYAYAALD